MATGRALNGLSQAIICTYTPVWINEFSSKANQTTWMGLVSAATILGTVLGSIVGSIAADSKKLDI